MELVAAIPHYVLPLAIVVGVGVLGWIVEKVVLGHFRKLAARTEIRLDDLILDSFHHVVTLWFFLLGVYLAVEYTPLPEGYRTLFEKIVIGVALFAVAIALARFFAGTVELYANRLLPTSASLFRSVIYILVVGVGVLIVLQTVGINVTPLITALGVGGLAVALALQDTLSNLFAGIYLLLVRQINPGDYVRLESGEEGYVTDITWRNTTLRMLSNNLVVVPNTKVASLIVTNYSLPQNEMSVLVQVGVSYDSDLEHVERVTIEVAREVLREVPGGVPEFEPFIRYHTFGDFSINFTVILRARTYVDQFLLKHEFVKRLHRRYRQEGIEIPFPIRTVYLHESAAASPVPATSSVVVGNPPGADTQS